MKKFLIVACIPLFIMGVLFSAFSHKPAQIPPGKTSGNSLTGDADSTPLVTTVAHINRQPDGSIQYNFNERQAIFTVKKGNPSYERILSLAGEALKKNKPVKLIYKEPDILLNLIWPTEKETAKYLEWYRLKIINQEPERPYSLAEIDTLKFNDAAWQNWKIFARCTSTVPSLAEAQVIFNYCAAQGCYLGPTQVQPCIPFEYVRDGCFARAHKMRWIIETKYHYCSEKVFSYGSLNVKADKWGGCCVSWWYHVAPLIRVRSKFARSGYLCYVIDPGMFNGPVLLSTWLNAQKNTSCNAQASVTSYSIQPSSAYTPSYTTDPNYTQTNQDLVYYKSLGNTCPGN